MATEAVGVAMEAVGVAMEENERAVGLASKVGASKSAADSSSAPTFLPAMVFGPVFDFIVIPFHPPVETPPAAESLSLVAKMNGRRSKPIDWLVRILSSLEESLP